MRVSAFPVFSSYPRSYTQRGRCNRFDRKPARWFPTVRRFKAHGSLSFGLDCLQLFRASDPRAAGNVQGPRRANQPPAVSPWRNLTERTRARISGAINLQTAPTRAPVAGLFFPAPTVLCRDSRDNRDTCPKPAWIGRFVFPFCIFKPGHSRDTPGHFGIRTLQAVRRAAFLALRTCPAAFAVASVFGVVRPFTSPAICPAHAVDLGRSAWA